MTPIIALTDNATEKVKRLLQEKQCSALRVFVAGGGCSGHQYGMALAH